MLASPRASPVTTAPELEAPDLASKPASLTTAEECSMPGPALKPTCRQLFDRSRPSASPPGDDDTQSSPDNISSGATIDSDCQQQGNLGTTADPNAEQHAHGSPPDDAISPPDDAISQQLVSISSTGASNSASCTTAQDTANCRQCNCPGADLDAAPAVDMAAAAAASGGDTASSIGADDSAAATEKALPTAASAAPQAQQAQEAFVQAADGALPGNEAVALDHQLCPAAPAEQLKENADSANEDGMLGLASMEDPGSTCSHRASADSGGVAEADSPEGKPDCSMH